MPRVSLLVRLVLVVAIGSVVGAMPVRGGNPPDAGGALPERDHPALQSRPGTLWAPAVQPGMPTPEQPVRDVARKLNFACWTHHNQGPGCSSLVSELRFMFGSCRAWYGEACPGNAPAVPLPYGEGYGAGGLYSSGCPGCR